MKNFITYLICLLFILPILVKGQIKTYNLNYRMDFSIPHVTGNKAFVKSFAGTYDVTASLQAPIFDEFYGGVFLKYAQFNIGLNKIPRVEAELGILNYGAKIGYDYPISSNILFTSSIQYGYNHLNYLKIPCTNTDTIELKHRTTNVEPVLGLHFYVEKKFTIGLTVSYNLISFQFNPDDICLDSYKTFSLSDYRGNVQYFNLGLGVIYQFWKKKGMDIE